MALLTGKAGVARAAKAAAGGMGSPSHNKAARKKARRHKLGKAAALAGKGEGERNANPGKAIRYKQSSMATVTGAAYKKVGEGWGKGWGRHNKAEYSKPSQTQRHRL